MGVSNADYLQQELREQASKEEPDEQPIKAAEEASSVDCIARVAQREADQGC